MTYEIIVQLKKEVLDPEGRAIQEALNRLGFNVVKQVAVTKRYLVELDAGSPDDMAQVERMAREVLANPVSETYQIRKL